MKIVEHRIKHGEILIDAKDKIFSFGIDEGIIYFWATQDDENKSNKPPQKYVVLDNGDEIGKDLHHVATLVEGIRPKHIFIEYIPDNNPKHITKVITDKGTETIETPKTDD